MSKKVNTKYGPGKIVGYRFFNEVKYIRIKLELGPNVYLRWDRIK